MVAGSFMVMNSDSRHPKEFSTENTSGGDVIDLCDPASPVGMLTSRNQRNAHRGSAAEP
jgi:hypothetical protein